jgi:hypothetical protein
VQFRDSGVALERAPAADHLVEHGAEREDVAAAVHLEAPYLFRRHVPDGAQHHRSCEGGRRRRERRLIGGGRFDDLCDSEVEDLDPLVARDPDVVGLEIAVHDPQLVSGRQPRGQLRRPCHRDGPGKGTPLEPAPQGGALEQFRHQEERAIVLPDVVQRQDVGVVQAGHDPRFAFEALPSFAGLRNLRRQQLDRHVAAEPGVVGLVHLSHAPPAKGREHRVGSEAVADGQPHALTRSILWIFDPWQATSRAAAVDPPAVEAPPEEAPAPRRLS